jgi:hypothetical protein
MNIYIAILVFLFIINVILGFITEKSIEDYREESFLYLTYDILLLFKIYKRTKQKKYLYLFIVDTIFIIILTVYIIIYPFVLV